MDMNMKRVQSPNAPTHQPSKRAKIDLPSQVLRARSAAQFLAVYCSFLERLFFAVSEIESRSAHSFLSLAQNRVTIYSSQYYIVKTGQTKKQLPPVF
jgi:hypothetical protein